MTSRDNMLPSLVATSPRPLRSTEKIRVLCLHGFRNNKQVMIDQTRGIRAALGDSAEFIYLNGAFEAKGPADPMIESAYAESAPFYEWFENLMADGRPIQLDDPESWPKYKGEPPAWICYHKGIEQSMAKLDEEIRRHGPFDVVIGFSQGAVVLSIMTMWYLRHGNARWWKLAICFNGAKVRGVNVRSLFEDEQGCPILVPLPSIHVVGKADPYFEDSRRMAKSWSDEADGFKKWVFEHEGGHRLPSVSKSKEFYTELGRVIKKYCRNENNATVSKL